MRRVSSRHNRDRTVPFRVRLLNAPRQGHTSRHKGSQRQRRRNGRRERSHVNVPVTMYKVLPEVIRVRVQRVKRVTLLQVLIQVVQVYPVQINTM